MTATGPTAVPVPAAGRELAARLARAGRDPVRAILMYGSHLLRANPDRHSAHDFVVVVDDYGEAELAQRTDAARDRRAADLGLAGRLEFKNDGRVTVTLVAASSGTLPAALQLRLTHPTLPERDLDLSLAGAAGNYQAVLERPAGRYYLEAGDPEGEWRLTGELSAAAAGTALEPLQ